MNAHPYRLFGAALAVWLTLSSVSGAADNTWTNAATTFGWNFVDGNWTAPPVWVNGDAAIFGPTGVGTITLAPGLQAFSVNFAANGYTLTGGDLTLVAGGSGTLPNFTIQVGPTSGTGPFAATIDSLLATTGGLNKIGLGTLTLSNPPNVLNVGTFPIASSGLNANVLIGSATDPTVLGGTLALANAAALGGGVSVAIGNGALQIGSNNVTIADLTFANTSTLASFPSVGVFGAGGGTLTVASNVINVIGNTTGRGHSFGANLNLPAAMDLRIGASLAGTNELSFSGVISGPGGLSLSSGVSDTGAPSTGGITLRASNSYAGGFTLNSTGSVLVDVNSTGAAAAPTSGAFGTGTLTIAASGTLASPAATRTVGNAVTVNSDFSIAGLGGLNFTGNVDLNTSASPIVRAITVNGPAIFNGVVMNSGGAATLQKLGTGTLTLNAANTYSGGTTLSAGSLALGNDQALGTLPLTVSGNSGLQAAGNARTIANAVVFDQPTTVQLSLGSAGVALPLTITGSVDLNSSAVARSVTFNSSAGTVTTIAGPITDSNAAAGITKTGTGTLVLSGTNAFDGTTAVSQGTLALTGVNTGAGATTVAPAGTIQFVGNTSFASGAIGVSGTLQPLTSGAFSRTVASDSGMTVLVGPGLTPVFSGQIVPGTGATFPFTKSGPGSLTLTSPNTSGVMGVTSVTGGDLVLGGPGGNLALASGYSVTGGSRLTLDNSSGVANRLNDTAGVTLNSGELRVLANVAGATAETAGALNVSAGQNTVTGNVNGGTGLTLNFAGYTAPANPSAAVLFRGQNLGTPGGLRVLFTASPPPSGTLLTRALGDNNPTGTGDFLVEYSTLNGVQQVTYTPGLVIQNLGPTLTPTTAHFQVTGAASTVDNSNTVASLTFSGTNASLDASSGALILSSGQIVVQNPVGASDRTITGGTLLFGVGGTGAAATFSTQRDTTVTSNLVGDSGLVKNGLARLTLAGSLANLSGPLAVNGGTVAFVNNANLTNLSGNGTIDIGLGANLTLNSTANQSVGATLTGLGTFRFNPASVLTATLLGPNSHAGGTESGANGRLSLRHPNALGTGPVTLQAAASSTFSVPLMGFDFGANATATVSNAIQLPTTAGIANVFAIANSNTNPNQTVTFDNRISGGSATSIMVFDENGTSQSHMFRLTSNQNDFQSTIRVQSGGLAITSNAALGDPGNGLQLNSLAPARGTLRFDAPGITLATTRAIAIGGSVTINTNGNDATIDGPMSGSLSIDKIGAGTLTLTNNAQTYTGPIFVRAGTLSVTGTIPFSLANMVTVNAAAALAGTGTINRPVVVDQGGFVDPGSTPGILTINGGMTLGGTLRIEAGDALNVLGNYSNTGTSGVMFLGMFNVATTYNFVTYSGAYNGVPFVNVIDQPLTHSLVYGPGVISLVPVPEPAHVLLFCAGFAAVWRFRRRAARLPHLP